MSKIIQHTANGTDWLIVEVPEGYHFQLYTLSNEYSIWRRLHIKSYSPFNVSGYDMHESQTYSLPDGNWHIHCIAEDASEEQAIEIVEGIREQGYSTRYRNYMGSGYYASIRLSVESLITHYFGLNNYKHVILKKI